MKYTAPLVKAFRNFFPFEERQSKTPPRSPGYTTTFAKMEILEARPPDAPKTRVLVYHREAFDTIVRFINSHNSVDHHFHVVGAPGMGKTSLARVIYAARKRQHLTTIFMTSSGRVYVDNGKHAYPLPDYLPAARDAVEKLVPADAGDAVWVLSDENFQPEAILNPNWTIVHFSSDTNTFANTYDNVRTIYIPQWTWEEIQIIGTHKKLYRLPRLVMDRAKSIFHQFGQTPGLIYQKYLLNRGKFEAFEESATMQYRQLAMYLVGNNITDLSSVYTKHGPSAYVDLVTHENAITSRHFAAQLHAVCTAENRLDLFQKWIQKLRYTTLFDYLAIDMLFELRESVEMRRLVDKPTPTRTKSKKGTFTTLHKEKEQFQLNPSAERTLYRSLGECTPQEFRPKQVWVNCYGDSCTVDAFVVQDGKLYIFVCMGSPPPVIKLSACEVNYIREIALPHLNPDVGTLDTLVILSLPQELRTSSSGAILKHAPGVVFDGSDYEVALAEKNVDIAVSAISMKHLIETSAKF